jgi:hypothetical protein
MSSLKGKILYSLLKGGRLRHALLGNHGSMMGKECRRHVLFYLHLGTDPSSWTQDDNLGRNNLSRYLLR